MHELSIVSSIVDSVTETLAAYPGARVKEVRLRVGALASVVEDSLQFCYGIATEDTPLEGSALVVKIAAGGCCIATLRRRMWRSRACRAFAVPAATSRFQICGRAANWRLNPSRLTKLRKRYDHPDCGAAAGNPEEER